MQFGFMDWIENCLIWFAIVNHEDGHVKERSIIIEEKGVNWKVSVGDLIILIEFVCVEVGRGATKR